MPFDAGELRERQERIRSDEQQVGTQPAGSESPGIPEHWRPAVLHSVNEAGGEIVFHLLDYTDAPPSVGQGEVYGNEKTGYPVPPLAASVFSSQTQPAGEAVTSETPVVLAKRNRRGDWLIRALENGDGNTSSGTYVFGGYTDAPLCAGGITGENDFYSPDRWIRRAPLVCPGRAGHGGVAVGGAVYAMGGFRIKTDSDASGSPAFIAIGNLDEYRPDAWVAKTNLPYPARYELAAFELGGKGFAAGGSRSTDADNVVLRDLDEYTPTSDGWRSGSPMGVARMGHTAFTIQGAAYVCGGNTSNRGMLKSVERYVFDTWSAEPPPSPDSMPSLARRLFASFALQNHAYVMGGLQAASPLASGFPFNDATGALRDVDRFDPVTGTWLGRANMCYQNLSGQQVCPARRRHTASAIDQSGYVFGGDAGGGSPVRETLKYNDVANTWSAQLAIANPPRSMAAAA